MENKKKIIIWAVIIIICWSIFGGNIFLWGVGVLIGKSILKLLFTITVAIALYILFYVLIIGGAIWIMVC